MKTILLVGEGKTDIGVSGPGVLPEEEREGVVQALVRKVLDASPREIAFEARTLRRIMNLPRKPGRFKGPKLAGDARKAYLGYQLARRDYDGFIMVRDSDHTGTVRREQMQNGIDQARDSAGGARIPASCGLAIETIEAWVLGAAPSDQIERHARGKKPETLWGKKGARDSRHPHDVCGKVLESMQLADNLSSKVAVVERGEVGDIETRCPNGFAPFATSLRENFGSWMD